MSARKCEVEGCGNKFLARGMCSKHYKRAYSKGMKVRKSHGMYKTPVYSTWLCMNQRCSNPNNVAFKYYGGRGISVCGSWRESFQAFIEDMGDRPAGTSIDRIDSDGNYEKSNCKWSTKLEQSNNTRMLATNKSGIEGVWWSDDRKRWQVDIQYNKVNQRLGRFKDFFDACCARKSAELKVVSEWH